MNYGYTSLQGVDQIPDIEYEGYIWLSDEDTPRRVTHKSHILEVSGDSFIVEGNLWSQAREISISIRHTNSGSAIGMVDLARALEEDVCMVATHAMAHRIAGVDTLSFVQSWVPVPDNLCEKMEVLQPGWVAFNGFNKEAH